MSLEQQIGALVKASENLTGAVNGKIGEIDKKVDAATNAVPVTVKSLFDQTLYVNEATGNDNNLGNSDAAPLKYLSAAVERVPAGGRARIIVRNNVTVFHNKWPLDGQSKHDLAISSGRSVYIDLTGHYLLINTSHYNSWSEGHLNIENPCLDKNFSVKANSFLEINNGSIKIVAQSGDEGKALYSHTDLSCVFNNDSSRTQLAGINLESTVASVGLFGLDNWGSMGFNTHMRDVNLTGVGILKRIINGANKDDIIIKKMNVSSTWTE